MLKQLYLLYGELESKIWTPARCACEDTLAQRKRFTASLLATPNLSYCIAHEV